MRLVFYFLFFILLVGCKYSDRQSLISNDVDTLLIDYSENYIEKSKYEEDLSNIRSEMNLKIDSLKKLLEQNITLEINKFHIIVGSFSVHSNAINYSRKMNSFGYNSNIIMAGNGFEMVTTNSYNNLRKTLDDLKIIRESVTENAWIYISK